MKKKLITIFSVAWALSCSKNSKSSDDIEKNSDKNIPLTDEAKENQKENDDDDDTYPQYFIYKEDNPEEDGEDSKKNDDPISSSFFGISTYDTRYGTGKHNEKYCSENNFLKPYSSKEPWINMFSDFYKNSVHSNSFCIHYNYLPSQSGIGWVKDCGFGKVLINNQCEELLIKYSEDKSSGGKFQVLGQTSGYEIVRSRAAGEISMPIGQYFTDSKDFAHLPYYQELRDPDSYYSQTITYAYQTNEEFSFSPSKEFTRLALQSRFEKINGFYGGNINAIPSLYGTLKSEYENQLRRDKRFADMRPELLKEHYKIDDNFSKPIHIKIDFFGKHYDTKNHSNRDFQSWCKSLNDVVKITNAAFEYGKNDYHNIFLCELKEVKDKPDYTGYERLYGFSFSVNCSYKDNTECGFLSSSTTKGLDEKYF